MVFFVVITDWHNVTWKIFTAQQMWNLSQALSYLLFFSSPDHSLWSLTTNSTNQCRPGCQQKVLPGVLQCPSIVNNLQTVVSHCKQEVVCCLTSAILQHQLGSNSHWLTKKILLIDNQFAFLSIDLFWHFNKLLNCQRSSKFWNIPLPYSAKVVMFKGQYHEHSMHDTTFFDYFLHEFYLLLLQQGTTSNLVSEVCHGETEITTLSKQYLYRET